MSTLEIASSRPVSPSNLELLRIRLERNRVEREKQLHRLSAVRPDNAPDVVADAYRASVERILSETRAALIRMDNGTFGRCESCDEAIPLERLELVPHAICCVRCAQRWVRER
jgi:RNA polymerase-binding transcription factor DksA